MTEQHHTPQKILVTGTNGMLGRPLAARLQAEGRTVIGFDMGLPSGGDPGFGVEMGDLRDFAAVTALFDRYGFDGVVHCGGISGPMVMPENPSEVCHINIDTTVHLLELARVREIKRFVYCSSIAAYGTPDSGELSEDSAFRPADVYGATKAAGDALVHAYRNEHGLSAIALRIARVYGPGRTTASLIRTLIADALAGDPTQLTGDGSARYHYVYRDDVVAALALALDAPPDAAAAYNIAGAEFASDDEVAGIVRDLIPDTDISFGAPDDRPVSPALDIRAAKRDLGYAPAVDLRTGIESYIDWMRKG